MGHEVLTVSDLVRADQNGEYGLTIPLRIDKVERTRDHDWWAQLLHCSDVHGAHAKITIFDDDDVDLTDYKFEENCWYRFTDVNPDVYQGTVGVKAKWSRQVTRISSPPELPSGKSDDIVRLLGDATKVAALDIETISTVSEKERDPTNPDHHELLCTGVGYRSEPGGAIEADVLFRDGSSATAELQAIEAIVNWLDDREVDVLITFGGAWFDLPILIGRSEQTSALVDQPRRGKRIKKSFESLFHADLSKTKNRVIGRGSLEDMASHVGSPTTHTEWSEYDFDISPRSWRERQWEAMKADGRDPPSNEITDTTIFNSDIPYIGREWLSALEEGEHEREEEIRACLEAYTLADIRPLFEIANCEAAAGQPAIEVSHL